MRRLWYILLFLLIPAAVGAQTLPATVNIGMDPPTDGPNGYNVALDGGAVTFVPLPATQTCTDFFTGAQSPCVVVSVVVQTAGVHTVSIAEVTVGGPGTAAGISFNLTVPGQPQHLHVVKTSALPPPGKIDLGAR